MEDTQSDTVETLDPVVEEGKVEQVWALDMEASRLYITYERRARYFCKLEKVEEDKDRVAIMAYYPEQAEWHHVFVPMRYMMKVLNKEEQEASLNEIAKTTKDVREVFARFSPAKTKAPGEGRPAGNSSGMGMLACWGKFFKEFAHTDNQREKIRAAMKNEFPTKHESVDRWLDAYRGYYNKGRLPPTPAPEVEISKEEWLK